MDSKSPEALDVGLPRIKLFLLSKDHGWEVYRKRKTPDLCNRGLISSAGPKPDANQHYLAEVLTDEEDYSKNPHRKTFPWYTQRREAYQ